MTLTGARGLSRISQNPDCELQAAMVAGGHDEPDFYRSITGENFPGEYGERVSAIRRGTQFNRNLYANNAAALRTAIAPLFGYDPRTMWVRNFEDEVPMAANASPQRLRSVHNQRLSRMHSLFTDLARGQRVPELLIEPQLRIPIASTTYAYVASDFAVLDPQTQMYVVGENKAFIAHPDLHDRADLETARRQAGAELIGLRNLATQFQLDARVDHRVIFVFATPYGLRPAPPFVENLDAEVRAIHIAIERLRLAQERLTHHQPVDAHRTHFQDTCHGTCILASVCEERLAGSVQILGDAASDLFGPDFPADRIVALAHGATLQTPAEIALLPYILDVARDLELIA